MSEFTKEEISLCRQIAEKHRKEVKYGDWYIHQDEILLWKMPSKMTKEDGFTSSLDYVTPLWTISDCLEFLKEKGGFIVDAHDDIGDIFSIEIETACGRWKGTRTSKTRKKFIGKGLLEACLKAVLAVLEEAR